MNFIESFLLQIANKIENQNFKWIKRLKLRFSMILMNYFHFIWCLKKNEMKLWDQIIFFKLILMNYFAFYSILDCNFKKILKLKMWQTILLNFKIWNSLNFLLFNCYSILFSSIQFYSFLFNLFHSVYSIPFIQFNLFIF